MSAVVDRHPHLSRALAVLAVSNAVMTWRPNLDTFLNAELIGVELWFSAGSCVPHAIAFERQWMRSLHWIMSPEVPHVFFTSCIHVTWLLLSYFVDNCECHSCWFGFQISRLNCVKLCSDSTTLELL